MKKNFLREFLLAVGMVVASQTTITSQTAQLLRVEGDGDKFYPVAKENKLFNLFTEIKIQVQNMYQVSL